MHKAFEAFPFQHGLLYDYSDNQFPTKLYAFCPDSWYCNNDSSSTKFIYCYEQTIIRRQISGTDVLVEYKLEAGMYSSVHGDCEIAGAGIIIERLGYGGQFMIGGPTESIGRLKYIDGCTDSLLIPPVKLGDPCLNALYFPAGIDQTEHIHPSMRVGMIVSGRGECVTPDETIELTPGMIFIIHQDGLHKFRTPFGEDMVVIAYHPDSDFGPTDEEHPMLNRTIVDGVSAKNIDSIRTK